MKRILTLLALLLSSVGAFSQTNYLYLSDPQSWWVNGPGRIDEALMTLKPHGLYVECGVYLTYSAKSTNYQNVTDTFEVIHYFTLPEEAMVIDSWLWVDDVIQQADILDRWTASNIYEGIVKRRKDPSVVYKNGPEQYEMRIFPLTGDGKRKVKLTLLLPVDWTSRHASISLPVNIIQESLPVSAMDLIVFENDRWKLPIFPGIPDLTLENLYDPIAGNYRYAKIPAEKLDLASDMQYPSPATNGVYWDYYQEGSDGFYQLAFIPSAVIPELQTPQKLLVGLDHTAGSVFFKQDQVLDQMALSLKKNLQPNDSFNLVYSKLGSKLLSEHWIPAKPDSIDHYISLLKSLKPDQFSNIPLVYAFMVERMKLENGVSGILFTNSSSLSDVPSANDLLGSLKDTYGSLPPIHIVDYYDGNVYVYVNNYYYRGNEYFFLNVSKSSGAEYYRSSYVDFGYQCDLAVSQTDATIQLLDLHTDLSDGYCYGRYSLGEGEKVTRNRGITQTGRMYGQLPFTYEINGKTVNGLVSASGSLNTNDAATGSDSITRTIWYGAYLRELEQSVPQSNAIIADMIQTSLENRILSLQTAFLALEPNLQDPCLSCPDETELVGTEDPSAFSRIRAYPNPFHEEVLVEVEVLSGDAADARLEIYDLGGQLIRVLSPDAVENQTARFRWNGRDAGGQSVAAGIYVGKLMQAEGVSTIRLAKG